MDWRLYWGKLSLFVYKENEQILQKTIIDVKEKLNIDFVETFFGYNKVYKFKDFSLSYLSSTSYSQHLDGICDINFNSKELYVICPVVLRYGLYVEENDKNEYEEIIKLFLKNLKFFNQQKNKHIFFLPGDNKDIYECMQDSIVFTVSPSLKTNGLPLYYTSPTICNEITDITTCPIDVSFQGSLNTHSIRPKSVNTLYKIKNYSTLIECNFEFIEFLENKDYLRSTYKKSIERCKFVLCPRGRGSNSIRFYEALNFGKIPILISDDTKLPLMSKINYSEFSIKIPEKDFSKIENYIDEFLRTHDIKTASEKARETSMKWFSADSISDFVNESIKEKITKNVVKEQFLV